MATAERFAHGCAGCHSTAGNVPLDGSKDSLFNGSNGPPFGTMYAPNLTPGGPLKDWSDGEIIRAIREGVDQSGRPLVFMPSDTFHNIGDADVQALVAYLRSQPAVQHDTPPRDISILGTILVGAGLFPTAAQPPITQPVVAPEPGPTPAYGEYLVNITGCRTCHGQNLTGRPPGGFGPPAGQNLVAVVPTWSEADFVKMIRTGVDPKGHALNPDQMPWKDFSAVFTDDNLKAIYAYLHGLKPK
jgi:mono/diheme cytochrome c family protein